MSIDPKQPTAPPQPGKPIAVRVLFFSQATDLPGKSVATSLTASAETNRSHHTIEWHPQMRHHRITYVPIEGEPMTRMIHESRVASWEPA